MLFGGCDFFGRISAAYFPKATAKSLFAASLLRSLLIPALLFTNVVPPSNHWAAPRWFATSDAGVCVLLSLSAATNGFLFASAAAAGPACVEASERGRCATSLVARIFAGNTAGTLFSVFLSFVLAR